MSDIRVEKYNISVDIEDEIEVGIDIEDEIEVGVNTNIVEPGIRSYNELADIPTLENVEIKGAKTASDFGLQKEISENNKIPIDFIKINAYSKINKIKDYLYEIHYNDLDYDWVNEYCLNNKAEMLPVGGCSAIRKNNLYGRNLDWTYDNSAEFLVKTPGINGGFAVMGMTSSVPSLTNEFVESAEYSEIYKLVPFKIVDGINEKGLVINTNVVPLDKGQTTNTIPEIEQKLELCALMLPRYVLENFATAQEAVNYLKNYVSIYPINSMIELGYETHYMIADKTNTYLIEMINNNLVITEMTDNSNSRLSGKPYMTNFYLSDVVFNADGKVYTPEYRDGENNAITFNQITPHGAGLERYNLIVDRYNSIETKEDMRELLTELFYTNTYKSSTEPKWYSELVGINNLDVASTVEEYTPVFNVAKDMFQNRTREPDTPYSGTRHTMHSAIYNLENKSLSIVSQEDGEEITFTYKDLSLITKVSDLENDIGFVTAEYHDNTKVDKDGDKVLSDNNYTTAEKTKLESIDMSTKQDVLVSGQNIKTINNQSILGSGNANISIPTKTSDLINDSRYVTDAYHDDTKVDKDGGKVLSDNNYTTAEKTKLESLENYDDTELKSQIDKKVDLSDIQAYGMLNKKEILSSSGKILTSKYLNSLNNNGKIMSIGGRNIAIFKIESRFIYSFVLNTPASVCYNVGFYSAGLIKDDGTVDEENSANYFVSGFLNDGEKQGKLVEYSNIDIPDGAEYIVFAYFRNDTEKKLFETNIFNGEKLVEDENYVHTDNNYTNADKAKVTSIPDDAQYTDTVYDDTSVTSRLSSIEEKETIWNAKQDALVAGVDYVTTAQIANFVTKAVSDLTNYYTKSETYTQAEIDNKLSVIPKFDIKVVTVLPTSNISNTTIYLLPNNLDTDNLYTEYIYIDNNWEVLGSQSIDLTGYATENYVNTAIADIEIPESYDDTEIRGLIPTKTSDLANDSGFITAEYHDSTKVDKDGDKVLSDNNYTTAEKTKLESIDMSTKQDVLVSGQNIKTINNQSILGSGNIDSSSISDFQKYGMYVIEDITGEIAKYTDAYIDSLGDLHSSSSNHLYKIDLSKYKLTYFKAHSRSKNFYSVAFYSSTDTFDNTTFIANGSLKGTTSTDTEYEFDNIITPDGALTVLLYSYSSYDKVIRGVSYYTVANKSKLDKLGNNVKPNEILEKSYYVGNSSDYQYQTISEAIEQWIADEKPVCNIYRDEVITPSKIYRVSNVTELLSAVAELNVETVPATIYIASGIYNICSDVSSPDDPFVIQPTNLSQITIIGEDRNNTIIKSSTGKYVHQPLQVMGGNVTLKNLTFWADHSDNPNFTYRARIGSYNSAYALHIDGGTVSGGIIKVDNCNCWSWQSCGLGLGTIQDSNIMIKDCDIRSLGDFTPTQQGQEIYIEGSKTLKPEADLTDAEKILRENYAKYAHGARGAIIYHPFYNSTDSNETFTMLNNSVYIKNANRTMYLSGNSSTANVNHIYTFIGNTFTNTYEENNLVVIDNQDKKIFNKLNANNNIPKLNDIDGLYSINIK